ncbi:hypothetical protein EZV62_004958 [Acer yangbiense]|uniref:Uncharacterized protein n=1 Tax=Acer yangbiense TaxID=1000413 RepID=A0A5C7IL58_9ROSI|nr:hypothetical protein EZV62_004958 [Acer yangbiense]
MSGDHGNTAGVLDLEKMTLADWFDYMEDYLSKYITDETEKLIREMQMKAKRVDKYMRQQKMKKGSASKKTRGRTRLQLLHLQKELIQVELNVLRQPIGEPGHKLGQYIGFIRKHRLMKKYEKSSNEKEKLSELINDVGKEQWNLLVKFWNSEKGNNRSETNKTNYGKMMMHHTGGTKSFARLRDELDPEGKEPDKITMFKATYTKKKDKSTDPTVANAMVRCAESK